MLLKIKLLWIWRHSILMTVWVPVSLTGSWVLGPTLWWMVSSCEIDSLFCEDSTLDNVIAPPATLRVLTDILLYVVLLYLSTPTLNRYILKLKPLLFPTLNAIIFNSKKRSLWRQARACSAFYKHDGASRLTFDIFIGKPWPVTWLGDPDCP